MSAPVPVLTIDGPSGSGKGTIAALVAERLGWALLDSGALYRIVAAVALEAEMDLTDGEALAAMAAGLEIRFEMTSADTYVLTVRRLEDGLTATVVGTLYDTAAIPPSKL